MNDIIQEDEINCSKMADNAQVLIKKNDRIMTYCNAGMLATLGCGTALGVIYRANALGKNVKVYACETRPLLQGARLTSWELQQSGVDVTLITDNMAAFIMSKGEVDLAIVGCDRVAANGDTANKIGTMGVAILAKHFNLPIYIACPSSTIDFETKTGDEIVIEERDSEEVTNFGERRTGPEGMKVRNPAFDVTPHELIAGFITEKGIIKPPFKENLKKAFG